MAKRRTKKQKQKLAQKRKTLPREAKRQAATDRLLQETKLPKQGSNLLDVFSTNVNKTASTQEPSLLRVNSQYLKKDMLRSLAITSVSILSLIGIYFYLGYN